MQLQNLSIPWESLPEVQQLQLNKVSPSYKKLMILERLILAIILGIAMFLAFYFKDNLQRDYNIIIAISIWAILAFGLCYTAIKAFNNKGFAIRTHDLVVKKGWLFEQTHAVPLNHVQHCSISIGPLERIYGLASVQIYTAGGNSADVTLSGLTKADAMQLKDWLIKKLPDA